MGTNKQVAVFVSDWERLIATLAANASELPDLEKGRVDLQKQLEEIQAQIAAQGTHQAAKQEASKRIALAFKEGRQLAAFLRSGVKQRYGKDSEKVVEFGIPPFRTKRRTTPAKPEPLEPAAPAIGGPKTQG
jgi:hypothetical protein